MATDDEKYMGLALDEAAKCIPEVTAFCVGCVLVVTGFPRKDSAPVVLSRGYSRQYPGNTHAEANALRNASELTTHDLAQLFATTEDQPAPSLSEILKHTDLYTTLEPCTFRNSGGPVCAKAIVSAGIRRCIIGVGEPEDLVPFSKRMDILNKDEGQALTTHWMKGMEEQCLRAARRGH